jgi:hypothetical protein
MATFHKCFFLRKFRSNFIALKIYSRQNAFLKGKHICCASVVPRVGLQKQTFAFWKQLEYDGRSNGANSRSKLLCFWDLREPDQIECFFQNVVSFGGFVVYVLRKTRICEEYVVVSNFPVYFLLLANFFAKKFKLIL